MRQSVGPVGASMRSTKGILQSSPRKAGKKQDRGDVDGEWRLRDVWLDPTGRIFKESGAHESGVELLFRGKTVDEIEVVRSVVNSSSQMMAQLPNTAATSFPYSRHRQVFGMRPRKAPAHLAAMVE